MRSESVNFLWETILPRLQGIRRSLDGETLHSQLKNPEIELASDVEVALINFAESGSDEDFVALVDFLVRNWEFANEDPGSHLVLLGYLVALGAISATDVCKLAQVPTYSFAGEEKRVSEFSELARIIEEEDRMGIKRVDEDHFLQDQLLEFCKTRGFIFREKKA